MRHSSLGCNGVIVIIDQLERWLLFLESSGGVRGLFLISWIALKNFIKKLEILVGDEQATYLRRIPCRPLVNLSAFSRSVKSFPKFSDCKTAWCSWMLLPFFRFRRIRFRICYSKYRGGENLWSIRLSSRVTTGWVQGYGKYTQSKQRLSKKEEVKKPGPQFCPSISALYCFRKRLMSSSLPSVRLEVR